MSEEKSKVNAMILSEKKTVAGYIVQQLYEQLGITHVFGVAGDYAFPINDAVAAHPHVKWYGSCNELNAAYSADGYARTVGYGALCTTYMVGELSALNGVAGSYAEHVPVFHLVSMPPVNVMLSTKKVHHSLGNSEYALGYQMAGPSVVARAILSPENAVEETARLIHMLKTEKRPVYCAIPMDVGREKVVVRPTSTVIGQLHRHHRDHISDPYKVSACVAAIKAQLEKAASTPHKAAIIPGYKAGRLNLQGKVQQLVEQTHLPFAAFAMGKGLISETHPNFIGIYQGALMPTPDTQKYLEACDPSGILYVGTKMTDFSGSGAYTAKLDIEAGINIGMHRTRVGAVTYDNVTMEDVLDGLLSAFPVPLATESQAKEYPTWKGVSSLTKEGAAGTGPDDQVTAATLYPAYEQFLKPNDYVVCETGTSSMGFPAVKLPEGAMYQNQDLWGSIGWATPASVGASVANTEVKHRRTILVTGEGSHQLTLQECAQFPRRGMKPVIFCLDNKGYTIEKLLTDTPLGINRVYNTLPDIDYVDMMKAFGAKEEEWILKHVKTNGELMAAMKEINHSPNKGAYICVHVPELDGPATATELFNVEKETVYS